MAAALRGVLTAQKENEQSQTAAPPPSHSTPTPTPDCSFLHAWLALLRVVKCNGNLSRCRGSIRTSPNSLPIPSWSLTNLLASALLLFLFLTTRRPHPHCRRGPCYLYYCPGCGRNGACPLAHVRWSSNTSETRSARCSVSAASTSRRKVGIWKEIIRLT